MAIQVSYPGVYIEEFAPGAPIEGVGTSTAAFIGTAARGPIDQPKLIQSWDAFKAIFGDFISGPNTGYLGPAVNGFFLNGGTTCYVLRHGKGKMAKIKLPSRNSGEPAAMLATALLEGTLGNALEITVTDTSILKDALTGATLQVQRAETVISSIASDRLTLIVNDTNGFAVGDPLWLTDIHNHHADAVLEAVNRSANTLTLAGVVGGSMVFTGGTGKVRIADLINGLRAFRVSVPAGLTLSTILPAGSIVQVQGDSSGTSPTPHPAKIYTVESTGGDQVTLTAPLAESYSRANAANPITLASLEFDLDIKDTSANISEKFERLSMGPNHPNYWRSTVLSQLVSLAYSDPPAQADDLRPAVGAYTPDAPGEADDPRAAWTEINSNAVQYLNMLEPIDEISLVCIPGAIGTIGHPAQQAMRDHCEKMAYRFAILDSDLADTVETIPNHLADVRSAKGFAALYFPWILGHNPITNQDELWPPSGHIAGLYARTDHDRGVHKAPANIAIRGALGLQYRLTDDQQGPLNMKGIDVLRVFHGQAQPMIWGARTTATDKNWQYANIRRLFQFLEKSIQEGIRWAVFEPNNLQLWQKLKRTITEFLTRAWRDGALFGETADKAFYVRIDETLNPASTRALGRLYIEIGLCPTYPAEFIIVRIGIWQGGSQVSE